MPTTAGNTPNKVGVEQAPPNRPPTDNGAHSENNESACASIPRRSQRRTFREQRAVMEEAPRSIDYDSDAPGAIRVGDVESSMTETASHQQTAVVQANVVTAEEWELRRRVERLEGQLVVYAEELLCGFPKLSRRRWWWCGFLFLLATISAAVGVIVMFQRDIPESAPTLSPLLLPSSVAPTSLPQNLQGGIPQNGGGGSIVILQDLQMQLLGISSLPLDAQRAWEESTSSFCEATFRNDENLLSFVSFYATTHNITEVTLPSNGARRVEERTESSVLVTYNQQIRFQLTSAGLALDLTPMALARFPFQLDGSEDLYLEYLHNSSQPSLGAVTSAVTVTSPDSPEVIIEPSDAPTTASPSPAPTAPLEFVANPAPSETSTNFVPTNAPTTPPQSPTAQDSTPTRNPAEPSILTPGASLTPCQEQCQSLTALPVTADAEDFKIIILEYFQDPLSSPHGSSITCWDVSQVTDMSFAFSFINSDHNYYNHDLDDPFFQSFDQALNCWDTSNVKNMSHMFQGATAFDQDISSWDVSSVTDMSFMFASDSAFSSNLGSWDVSSVTDMAHMFSSATAFNSNIQSWDVSSVATMKSMFYNAQTFNQNLNFWDVSSVTDMSQMFGNAASFNQNLCAWADLLEISQVNVGSIFGLSGCDDKVTPSSSSSSWCQACS